MFTSPQTWDISSRSRATKASEKKAWCSLLFEGSPNTSVWRVVQRSEILSLFIQKDVPYCSQGHTWVVAQSLGPIASHSNNPILPFGLGSKAFCFSSDNVFWNSCIHHVYTPFSRRFCSSTVVINVSGILQLSHWPNSSWRHCLLFRN